MENKMSHLKWYGSVLHENCQLSFLVLFLTPNTHVNKIFFKKAPNCTYHGGPAASNHQRWYHQHWTSAILQQRSKMFCLFLNLRRPSLWNLYFVCRGCYETYTSYVVGAQPPMVFITIGDLLNSLCPTSWVHTHPCHGFYIGNSPNIPSLMLRVP